MSAAADRAAGDGRATLRERLRLRTQPAHQALETDLRLLDGHADALRMRALLSRFHGFHAGFEPALADRLAGEAAFVQARARLPALRADLGRLGLAASEIDALPQCTAAAGLAATEAEALGALYVMEGSTLGGQLITRELGGLPWWPAGGLTYFDPHGRATGLRWRETLARLEAAPPEQHDTLIEAADRAFRLLHGWLVMPSYSHGAAAAPSSAPVITPSPDPHG